MTFTRSLDELPASLAEATTLAGGKAANLAVMANELHLPVPPAFVITTETCRRFLADGWPDGLDGELRERMTALEAAVGRRFGDAADPLLVSVRSGAPVSMPGMMDTILDLGLTAASTAGLARTTGDPAFAEACRQRFEATFRSIVGVVEVPDDPWQQLRLAIEAVFRSWQSERAVAYRAREGIAEDLGTAVTIQAMVFGNRGETSATGVAFTRDPATGAPEPYGDILFDAQGDDVVAGTHHPEPLAALDARMPTVGAQLREIAMRLERHYADLCDIEFTIEQGTLWMLQVRVGKRSPQAALRIAVDMADDPDFPLTHEEAVQRVAAILAHPPTTARAGEDRGAPIATGLPASPGIASGPIVTDPSAAQASAAAGTPAILVRAETSPDDVHGMAVAAGILTSRGGLASHAAVVARGWGIPAVVGAAGLDVRNGHVVLGQRTLQAGDVLTIDGATGAVFDGVVPGSTEIAPEVQTLLDWAAELGIPIGETAHIESAPTPDAAEVEPDDVLRVIALKGMAPTQAVADATASSPEAVQPILDLFLADDLVSTIAGAYRLTAAGTERAAELRRADQEAWGIDRASAVLDAFLPIDHRVKEVVTAWQLRDDQPGQVINDHADAAYDAGVLDRLTAIHTDAISWLDAAEAGNPRLATVRLRLDRALDAARAGDARYVASPRVDSYHGIWFELHEELIHLAGRTREAEEAAGRA
jgi:pyruvate,orthophosphate dikinase